MLKFHHIANLVVTKLVIMVSTVFGAPQAYEDTFIHTHMSQGFSGTWLDDFVNQVKTVQPDVIEFHAARLIESDDVDVKKVLSGIQLAKEMSEKYAFSLSLIINLACTWRDSYDKDARFVYRVNHDGTRAGRWGKKHLCVNAPAVDEVIIPSFYRISKAFQPWQVWIDENVIGVNVCYCEDCTRLFKEQHAIEPPMKAEDAHWDAWIDFHRACFENWMEKVHAAVEEGSPDTIITFNHAYCLEQPQAPPAHIVNLSVDLLNEPLATGLYCRYGAAADVPYDVLTGLGTDVWNGGVPKSVEQIKEDVAVILANGGRWNIGEFPLNRETVNRSNGFVGDRPLEDYVRNAKAGADFARARQQWTHKTKPAAYGGVLHSATTHYSKVIPTYSQHTKNTEDGGMVLTSDGTLKENVRGEAQTRIYWPDNRYVSDSVVGTYKALIENHVQFHIINEDTLVRDGEQYRFVVIAEQFRLDERVLKALKRFAENGGVIIATGSTIESGLLEMCGINTFAKHNKKVAFEEFAFDSYYQIPGTAGRVLYKLDEGADAPLVSEYKVGQGSIVYFAVDFFDMYRKLSPYGHDKHPSEKTLISAKYARTFVGKLIDDLLPERDVTVSAPDYYEVAVNTKDGSTLVNLVDRSLNWSGPKTGNSKIDIAVSMDKKPGHVLLQPECEELDWQWEDGKVKTSVPVHLIDVLSIVEIR